MARQRRTRKITVTMPEDIAATLDDWRSTGRIASISSFVAESVKARVDRAESLARLENAPRWPPTAGPDQSRPSRPGAAPVIG
ncbi:hypothetical protein GL307_20405 [Nocardia seriolae]|uniref:hypothetical protein n=1 Tax=Nocardia seriolae TaxID=37332 RepID=UPI0012BBD244|nr:hypothetical protein [Nocardia seriolae]MTL13844.1 hypothetical protein [Nocardia seriolae]